MQDFIDSLQVGTKVNILGNEYTVQGYVDYAAENRPGVKHTKVFFNDHYVLVFSVSNDFVCFGQDIGTAVEGDTFEPLVTFNGKEYKLDAHDYQIVDCVKCGVPVELEGECEFWDYVGVENPKEGISMAIISRTKLRSDVVSVEITEADYHIV